MTLLRKRKRKIRLNVYLVPYAVLANKIINPILKNLIMKSVGIAEC